MVIYAIAGGPASGKTTFRIKAINSNVLPKHAFVHDCDAVMEALPGYQQKLAAEGPMQAFQEWELPARTIAEQQLQQQIAAKKDIIYDRSCSLPSSYAFIKELVEQHGYKLIMHLLYVAADVAKERAAAREAQTGRHIPLHLINERLQILKQLWPQYLALATEAYLLDNSAAIPKIIAEYKDNNLIINDHVVYESFNAYN